jgi:hypothetical protein
MLGLRLPFLRFHQQLYLLASLEHLKPSSCLLVQFHLTVLE